MLRNRSGSSRTAAQHPRPEWGDRCVGGADDAGGGGGIDAAGAAGAACPSEHRPMPTSHASSSINGIRVKF
eukprot:2547095-Prymnesium_polylepis.1